MPQILKDDVRKKIENSAIDILIEKGIENCDMRSVAKKAGFTTGNLYRYYKNKDQLIYSITQPLIDRLNEIILGQTQGEVGLESGQIRLPKAKTGQEPSKYVRDLLEPRLYVALIQLGQAGRQEPKRMEILLNATQIGDDLRQWAVRIVEHSIYTCFNPCNATEKQINIMVNVFIHSFCEGIMQLFKVNLLITPEEYEGMLKRFLNMQLSGLQIIITDEINNKGISPRAEVFTDES